MYAPVTLLSLCLVAQAVLADTIPEGPPRVFAAYYTWYGAPWGQAGAFAHWTYDRKDNEDSSQGTYDPENVVLPPAIRALSSGAYPLIGPYDSMEPEVVRWHMRLAKAAGIDAFLVDWWGPATWQTPKGWTHDVFVNTVLPVAEQEGFKVALFDECPQFVDDFEQVCRWTTTYLKRFKDSPAWLHIDGKPVWAVYQLWEGKLTADQGKELIRRVEAQVGPVFWIFDRMRCRATGPGEIELFTPTDWLKIDSLDCIMGYAMFSTWAVDTYEGLKPLYADFARQVQEAGRRVMLPVHPGHDNRRINPKPYWMKRRNGETLSGFWRAAMQAQADYILITSFNEWPETTVVEPSLTWGDPYQYLRQVAQLQGRTFEAPPLPAPDRLDPLAAQYLRNRYPTSASADGR